MSDIRAVRSQGRVACSLCGREVGLGEAYWTINGSRVCEECLPAFARMDYRNCRLVRGKEERP